MLDASTLSSQLLADLAFKIATAETTVFIHCAQGHGRTGLVAALVLIARGDTDDPNVALNMVKSSRPMVGLNGLQRDMLVETTALIQSSLV